MKVMHIIDSGGLYGAEVMLLNLMREQRKQGVEALLCSLGEPRVTNKALEIEAEQWKLPVIRLRMQNGVNLRGGLKISRLARDGNCDLLHTHGYKPNILLGCLPRRVRGAPTVATLHGWTGLDPYSRLGAYQWLDAFMLRRADAVVIVNRTIQQHRLFRFVKAKRVSVIDNGISIPADGCLDSDADSSITDFCKNGFIVGSIGRLSKEKGYNYLLSSIAALRSRGIPAKLIIIGEGQERHLLTVQIKRLSLEEHVLLPGYRTGAARYIALFNAFVLSSLTEGLPITMLEAMALRTPIVATRVGGIPDVLTDQRTGLLVPPEDPVSLADALEALHSSATLADSLRERAAAKVRRDYSCTTMAQRYLDIYNAIIPNRTVV